MQNTMRTNETLQSLERIYRNAKVVANNGNLTTLNTFTDQLEPLDPRILCGLADILSRELESVQFDLIIGEEDKGAHIATAVSIWTGKPMVLARWYTYSTQAATPASTVVPVASEYYRGGLVVHGLAAGSRAVIIDDTLSTGGTIIALVEAARKKGVEIVAILAVVEKVGMGGAERIFLSTGLSAKSLLRISVSASEVHIVSN
jgi:adenine phosphoribosyltransferase